MSAPSRLNKLAFVLAVLSGAAQGDGSRTELDPLAQYRTRDNIHGLYEIREAAKNFLAEERAKGGPAWIALGPNLKIQVTRCAVPVTVTWVPKSAGYSTANVSVNCRKTVRPQDQKNWEVPVPVYAE